MAKKKKKRATKGPKRTKRGQPVYRVKNPSNRQRGKSNLFRDRLIKAMPPGKRESKNGSSYFEYRKNRTDRPGSLTGYFNIDQIQSLDELKKAYWKLAKKHHPDHGGIESDFKALTAEYEELTNTYLRNGGFTKQTATDEIKIDEAFIEVVKAAMKLPNIDIEIIGSWIWVSGMTFPVRSELKALGFQFAPLKKMWYINTTGMKTKRGQELNIDEIRNRYTSRKLKRDDDYKFLEGINGTPVKPSERLKFKKALGKLIRTMKSRK